ncbi:MAG: site-specific integrase, partial [Acidimicrobiales bacterium]
WNLVTRNVAALATPPRPRNVEVQPFSLDQLRAILGAAAADRFEAAFVLAVTCGPRRGEILGLKWSDIELDDAPSLRVRRVVQRISGSIVAGDPKSTKSRRTIALSTMAVDALRRQRVRQAEGRLAVGAAWRDEEWVFTVANGGPVDPRNLLRAWYGVLERAELPKRPLHHARHGAASLMLSEGLPLKLVLETLGHSTMSLTADLYSHLMPGDAARVAAALDRAFGA